MRVIPQPLYRVSLLAFSIAVTACGGGSSAQEGESINYIDSLVNDDQIQPASGARELVMSEEGTTKKAIVQCFCDSLYRSTLLFYHFLDQNAVLHVEFDNTSSEFPARGVVHVFNEAATLEDIERWINNQHSDGLFINPAEPVSSTAIDEAGIAITSSAYLESISGFHGDEYEKYQIEFTVDNQLESGSFFLNGFSELTDVYLQTVAPLSD